MGLFYILIALFVGIAIPILFVCMLIFYLYRRLTRVRGAGTRISATVTKIEPSTANNFYRIFAQWQQPQTGKTFTYKAVIKNPERFPVGSFVPVSIDPKHPQWHILEIKSQ